MVLFGNSVALINLRVTAHQREDALVVVQSTTNIGRISESYFSLNEPKALTNCCIL